MSVHAEHLEMWSILEGLSEVIMFSKKCQWISSGSLNPWSVQLPFMIPSMTLSKLHFVFLYIVIYKH